MQTQAHAQQIEWLSTVTFTVTEITTYDQREGVMELAMSEVGDERVSERWGWHSCTRCSESLVGITEDRWFSYDRGSHRKHNMV
jgi:hypothetical protein